MSSRLCFGVIGCGDAGAEMWQGIDAASPAELVMLMDENADLLDDLSQVYAVPTTTVVEEVLSCDDVDAVYISAPMEQRISLGIRAAEAGKQVFLENPVASDLADLNALLDVCRANDVNLGVALGAQVDAGVREARRMIRAGFLGDVVAVRMDAFVEAPRARRRRMERAGEREDLLGALVEQINAVRWITGSEVLRVSAKGESRSGKGKANVIALGAVLDYENGVVGVLQGGWNLPGGEHEDVPGPRVYGTRGQLILAREPLVYFLEAPEGGVSQSWQPLRFSGPLGDKEQMVERFAAAVLEGEKPPVNGTDAQKALEVIEAIHRSAGSDTPQALPLRD
ncbi:MAG: Gfo/Idh/MocA family protein [Anaerolineales bacterium]